MAMATAMPMTKETTSATTTRATVMAMKSGRVAISARLLPMRAQLGATKGGQIAGPSYVAAGSQSAKAPKSTVPSPRRKRQRG